MQKILKIAQREYIETVKTKTFIIGLLMVPFIIMLCIRARAGVAERGEAELSDAGFTLAEFGYSRTSLSDAFGSWRILSLSLRARVFSDIFLIQKDNN